MSSRTAAETRALVEKSLRRRYWAERRFRAYGLGSVLIGLSFVLFLFGTLFGQGYSAFRQARISLEIFYDPAVIDPEGTRTSEALATANYTGLVRAALREQFSDVDSSDRTRSRALYALVSNSAGFELQHRIEKDSKLIGQRQRVHGRVPG
jgi:phosphate transport system permease protein